MLPMNSSSTCPTNCYRVYAIAARASMEAALGSNQLNGLAYLEVCDLVAVIGAQPEETIESNLTSESLTAFSDRIGELHQALDILPFRFARAATTSDIVSLLREHKEAYQENLRHVAGCTEVNARWTSEDLTRFTSGSDDDLAQLGSSSGGNYLRAKRRAAAIERASENELAKLAEVIGSRAGIPYVDTRSSLRRIRGAEQRSIWVFGLEILINRRDTSQYIQVLSETHFRNCLPMIASGPWPPFSFVKDVNTAMVKAPFCAAATAEPVQIRAIFSGTEAAS